MSDMKLLIAVSGMPHAAPMLAFAKRIADATGAQATILNVVADEADRDASQAMLHAAAEAFGDPEVPLITRTGAPTDQILEEAKEGEYDLVILGARTRPPVAEALLGSVARKVVTKSPISVLVVRGDRTEVDKILIATGGTRYADPTVQEGLELARLTGAEVTLLHVTMPAATMYTGLNEVDERLTELLESGTPVARHLHRASEAMQGSGVPGELRLRHGVPREEILREAALEDYDLLVIGGRFRRGMLPDFIWGEDVTGAVLDRAERPVLVARGSSTGRWEDRG